MRNYSPGSVRKMHGKWQCVISYQEASGAQRQITHMTSIPCKPGKGDNSGKKAAMDAMRAWRSELVEQDVEGTQPRKPTTLTVFEYCTRYYDALAASQAIEPSTAADYRKCLKKLGELGNVKLADLAPTMVQDWETELLQSGLSPTTVGKPHRVLKQAMRHAYEMGDIQRDPMRGVKPPKRPKTDPNALDASGCAKLTRLLSEMAPNPLRIAASLALYAGLRAGEVCALRWRNVDLEGGRFSEEGAALRVAEAVGRGEGGTYIKQPKTGGSMRTVPIPAPVARMLAQRRDAMVSECMEAGAGFDGNLYVCGSIDGSYYDPTALTKQWKSLADSYDLRGIKGKRVTFHDLRHTFATVAIAGGADVKSVSSIMGHANAAMTLNVYASADPAAKRATMDRVGEALGRKGAEVIPFRPTGTDGSFD